MLKAHYTPILCLVLLALLLGQIYVPLRAANASSFPYTVQSGDTLIAIGNKFGVEWGQIATLNGISYPYTIYVGEIIQIPTASASGSSSCGGFWYTVQPGDSVYAIAANFASSPTSIESINSLVAPYFIYVNQQLKIPACNSDPPTVEYKVQAGDSLSSIGARFSIQWATIATANHLQSPYYIYVGQKLVLPGLHSIPSGGNPNISFVNREVWVFLWGDYPNALSLVSQHRAAVSVVSSYSFSLSNAGTFQPVPNAPDICPQVHMMGLACDPMIVNDQSNTAGINSLLTSAALQSSFIKSAVNKALNLHLDGYNVDFEPTSSTLHLSVQYGNFLSQFANAMHTVGKRLSVDVATWDRGRLWNLSIEGASTVDLVLTMDTYNEKMQGYQNALSAVTSEVPLNKVAVGLLTVTNDATLSQRMKALNSAGVPVVMLWPSFPSAISDSYFNEFAYFLS